MSRASKNEELAGKGVGSPEGKRPLAPRAARWLEYRERPEVGGW